MPEFQQLQFGGLDTPKALPRRKPGGGFGALPRAAVASRRHEEPDHDWSKPRDNYPQAEGQQVMGVHDLSQQHELDRHGNVYDSNFPLGGFRKWGPQMSDSNRKIWNQHAETRQISVNAVLHTRQSADFTGDHSYIQGPMHPDSKTAVYVHKGTPYIVDGHHRLAEARGRGDTHFQAEVLNGDQLAKSRRYVETPSKKDVPGIVSHLIGDHGMERFDGINGTPLSREKPKQLVQRHDAIHRQRLLSHTHTPPGVEPANDGTPVSNPEDNPQNRRSDVPNAKQSFMDNTQPKQFGVSLAHKQRDWINRPAT